MNDIVRTPMPSAVSASRATPAPIWSSPPAQSNREQCRSRCMSPVYYPLVRGRSPGRPSLHKRLLDLGLLGGDAAGFERPAGVVAVELEEVLDHVHHLRLE